MTRLSFREFQASDFPEYKSWFQDEQLDAALGPMDEEWLAYILQDQKGAEFAVRAGSELVAVVGVTRMAEQAGYEVITDFAVKPALRGTGVGSKVLLQLLEEIPLRESQYWVAYVERTNDVAQHFFTRHGWRRVEEDMIRYEYRVT